MSRFFDLKGYATEMSVVGYCRRTFFWGPFIVGFAVAYFLSVFPQTREVYLGILEGIYLLEPLQILQALLGFALVFLLCLMLHSWQRMLGTAALDQIYPEHANIRIDRILRFWRNILSYLSAFLPLFGLIVGLAKTTLEASDAGNEFNKVLSFFGKENFSEFQTTTDVLPFYAQYGKIGVAALCVLTIFLLFAIPIVAKKLLGEQFNKLYSAILATGGAVAIVSFLAPIQFSSYVVGLAKIFGPLASAAIFLISITCVIILVSYFSNLRGWKFGGWIVFFCLSGLVYLSYQALTPKQISAFEPAPPQLSAAAAPIPEIITQFDKWLEQRTDRAAYASSGYPIFIVAAQGGGIYATAATAAFLAHMQDACSNFAEHVFAISAVSGGAVGSAIFDALLAMDGSLTPPGKCNFLHSRAGRKTLAESTRRIVREDHLSPAVALIWPDIMRKLFTLGKFDLNSEFDRSSALERSFACSISPREARPFECGPPGGTPLGVPFESLWRPSSRIPALVLTSTWAETGFRAAFAPFKLHEISDGTLFTFPLNAKDEKDDFENHGIDITSPYSQTLIGAAMVSARFPGIVPAYQVRFRIKNDKNVTPADEPPRWNFVDGGYVDNSGATTAVEIYRALKRHIDATDIPAQLYLVLMTDANTDPNLRDVDNGTSFSDTVAPVTGLLNVRGQLAGRAVTRAIEQVKSLEKNGEAEGSGKRRVMTVNLKQDTFNLPLGWKISGTTDDIVRLMLGRPEFCAVELDPEALRSDMKTAVFKQVIKTNSCVKKDIIDLLSN